MNEAIKTISLDDVGVLQGQGNQPALKQASLMYTPQYGGGDGFQSMTTAGPTEASSAMPSMGAEKGSSFGTSMTRLTELFSQFDQGNARIYLILGSLVLAVAIGLFFISSDSLTSLNDGFNSMVGTSTEERASEALPDQVPVPAETNRAVTEAAPPAGSASQDLINPYWALPNGLNDNGEMSPRGVLTPSQEERWRQGLAHAYTWQRYKTVIEMRAARLKGTQFLLNDALAQPKFWTRMEALLALAELGEAIDIDTVEGGIGTTRRSLIQNYFRRFRSHSTSGEIYIMRQAVRVVDAGSRQVILENLARHRNEINDLYLFAATYDPNTKVKAWITPELAAHPVSQEVKDRFNRIVSGVEKPTNTLPPAQAGDASQTGNKVQDLKVEQLPDDVNVEDVYFLKEEDKQQEKAVPLPDDGFQQLEKK